MVGQVLNVDERTFEIIKQIGKGKGGYSYLAKSNNEHYVLKKIHYEPCGYFQFEENKLTSELRAYNTLRELGVTVPELLFSDNDQQYLIKDYIEGELLIDLAAGGAVKDEHIRQIFAMCRELYVNNLNIDYFPTNFVVRDDVVYYIDYECSAYSDGWNFENWGIYFLANANGAAEYVKNGNAAKLVENGKPIRRGLEKIVERWLSLKDGKII